MLNWVDPSSPYHKEVFASGKKLVLLPKRLAFGAGRQGRARHGTGTRLPHRRRLPRLEGQRRSHGRRGTQAPIDQANHSTQLRHRSCGPHLTRTTHGTADPHISPSAAASSSCRWNCWADAYSPLLRQRRLCLGKHYHRHAVAVTGHRRAAGWWNPSLTRFAGIFALGAILLYPLILFAEPVMEFIFYALKTRDTDRWWRPRFVYSAYGDFGHDLTLFRETAGDQG